MGQHTVEAKISKNDLDNIKLAERLGVSHLAITYPEGINCTLKKTHRPEKHCENITVPVCKTVQKVKVKNVTEDCTKQKDYCQYSFRTQEVTKKNIICQRSTQQICDVPCNDCSSHCVRNPIVVCGTDHQKVVVTEKRQKCGESDQLVTTKICFTYPDASWFCRELHDPTDCSEGSIRVVSNEVAGVPKIDCVEKEREPLCLPGNCRLADEEPHCLSTDLPVQVELEDFVCEECKHGRSKLRPVLVQVQNCDDEVTREFCVDGEAVSGEWVKTCRLPDAVLPARLRNILLQNRAEEEDGEEDGEETSRKLPRARLVRLNLPSTAANLLRSSEEDSNNNIVNSSCRNPHIRITARDGVTNDPIISAEARLLLQDDDVGPIVNGDHAGMLLVPVPGSGLYRVNVTAPSHIPDLSEVAVSCEDPKSCDRCAPSLLVSLSPHLEPGRARLLLNWASLPKDLDLYSWQLPDRHGSGCLTSWRAKERCRGARLDLDNTKGGDNGAETITYSYGRREREEDSSIYAVFVHDYSRNPQQFAGSGARLTITDGRETVKVRMDEERYGEEHYWWAGCLKIGGRRGGFRWRTVGTFHRESPVQKAGDRCIFEEEEGRVSQQTGATNITEEVVIVDGFMIANRATTPITTPAYTTITPTPRPRFDRRPTVGPQYRGAQGGPQAHGHIGGKTAERDGENGTTRKKPVNPGKHKQDRFGFTYSVTEKQPSTAKPQQNGFTYTVTEIRTVSEESQQGGAEIGTRKDLNQDFSNKKRFRGESGLSQAVMMRYNNRTEMVKKLGGQSRDRGTQIGQKNRNESKNNNNEISDQLSQREDKRSQYAVNDSQQSQGQSPQNLKTLHRESTFDEGEGEKNMTRNQADNIIDNNQVIGQTENKLLQRDESGNPDLQRNNNNLQKVAGTNITQNKPTENSKEPHDKISMKGNTTFSTTMQNKDLSLETTNMFTNNSVDAPQNEGQKVAGSAEKKLETNKNHKKKKKNKPKTCEEIEIESERIRCKVVSCFRNRNNCF